MDSDSESVTCTLTYDSTRPEDEICGPPKFPLKVAIFCLLSAFVIALLAYAASPSLILLGFFVLLFATSFIIGVISALVYTYVDYENGRVYCSVSWLAWCLKYIPAVCIKFPDPSIIAEYQHSRSTEAEEIRLEERQPAERRPEPVGQSPSGRVRAEMRVKELVQVHVMPSPPGAEGRSSSFSSSRDDTFAPESLPTDSVPVLSPGYTSTLSDFSEIASVSLSGIPPILSDVNLNADSSDQELFLTDEQMEEPERVTVGAESTVHADSELPKSVDSIEKQRVCPKKRYSGKDDDCIQAENFLEVEVYDDMNPVQIIHAGYPERAEFIGMIDTSSDKHETREGRPKSSTPEPAEYPEKDEVFGKIGSSVSRVQVSSEHSENINKAGTSSEERRASHSAGQKESSTPESAENLEKGEVSSKIGSSIGQIQGGSSGPSGNLNKAGTSSEERKTSHPTGHQKSSTPESAENVEKGEVFSNDTPVQTESESSDPSENINFAETSGDERVESYSTAL